MIHVVAIIKAKPGQRNSILKAFKDNMPAVHAEKGCVEYQPVVDADNAGAIQTEIGADAFMVIEKWETMDDLAAHAKSAHMAAYAEKVKPLIADRSIHVLSNVD